MEKSGFAAFKERGCTIQGCAYKGSFYGLTTRLPSKTPWKLCHRSYLFWPNVYTMFCILCLWRKGGDFYEVVMSSTDTNWSSLLRWHPWTTRATTDFRVFSFWSGILFCHKQHKDSTVKKYMRPLSVVPNVSTTSRHGIKNPLTVLSMTAVLCPVCLVVVIICWGSLFLIYLRD